MQIKISFSLATFLILVSGTTLSQCGFSPVNPSSLQTRTERALEKWPKTFELAFHAGKEGQSLSAQRTELLGPNLSFANPACSRLMLAAERSGETYAGHMIRERMRFGSCRKFVARASKIWDWPWLHGVPRGDLPPKLRGVYGAWQLRCADDNKPSRCALVQTSQPDNPAAGEITTHFRLVRVRGKMMPVWRVWVPRLKADWFQGLSKDGIEKWDRMLSGCLNNRQKFTQCLAKARTRFLDRRTQEVELSTSTEIRNLKFTKCTSQGCMIETPVALSAKAYADFIRGRSVSIKLYPRRNMPIQFHITSDGFHAAMNALANIDVTDNSVQTKNLKTAL